MSRKIDTDANINSIRFVQQTSHPASPASGYEQLYIIPGSAHGGLYVKDSAGKQIGLFLTGTSASTGMTFIEEIQPSGVPTGSFSSIPQTYNALKIVYSVRGSSAATYTNWVLRINQDYTDANYRRTFDFGFASSTTGAEGAADAVIGVINANNPPSSN